MQYRHPPLPNVTSSTARHPDLLFRWHLDSNLLQGVFFLIGFGLVILYSAGNENVHTVEGQCLRLAFAALVLAAVAQIPPYRLRIMAPWVFFVGLFFSHFFLSLLPLVLRLIFIAFLDFSFTTCCLIDLYIV